MGEAILSGKRILGVDDNPDILEILREEILGACPNCQFDKATTYSGAIERMASSTYDVIILDIVDARGFRLLELAQSRNFLVGDMGSDLYIDYMRKN